MNPVITGIVAGVLGTMVMDVMNHAFSRTGAIQKIDLGAIGRMSAGWARGRFWYRHPSEMRAVANETLIGYATHYAIGVGLAVPFALGWTILHGGAVSPIWALAYGVGTTGASIFFVYPAMGLGVFGRRSPEGLKAPLSSLANHFFFGAGMAVGVLIG